MWPEGGQVNQHRGSQITTGLIVTAVGVILLAGQLDVGLSWDIGRLWPAVFILIAVGKLASGEARNVGGAVWFLFLGGIFLLHTFRVLRLSESWPLFVVAGGVSMMFPRHRLAYRDRSQRP